MVKILKKYKPGLNTTTTGDLDIKCGGVVPAENI